MTRAEIIEAMATAMVQSDISPAGSFASPWDRYATAALTALESKGLAVAPVEDILWLRQALEEWGEYASDYFRVKWDLAGDLARVDAMLSARPSGEGGE